ncbi:MAG: excinuclease ABC subunit UvrC [Clostridia bacterium]|nr:excinuclease ABC subunit UvrC [Clostridia bacterium]
MDKEILTRIKSKLATLTTSPGVYKMLDESGNIIYIGKAKNLKNRVSSYFVATRQPEKVQQMVEHVYDFDYIVVSNEQEALNLESNLIHANQPFYNILLKDGKAFPYIKISRKDKFPKAELTRRVKKDNADYYGPFFGAANGTQILKIINNTFKLKDCNYSRKQKRACLRYQMGYCLAPCIGACSDSEYKKEVQKVVRFLKGDVKEARDILTKKMMASSESENYEKAMEYRDNLRVLDNLEKTFVTELGTLENIDIFAFATDGNRSVITLGTIRGGKMLGVNNYNVIDASLDMEETLRHFITQYYLSTPVIPDVIITSFEDDNLQTWLSELKGKKVEFVSPIRGVKKKLYSLCENNAKEDLIKNLTKQDLYERKTLGAMEELKKVLHLSKLPNRIEGYDISNIQGTNTVSSMVVFTGGVPNKSHYRKFKIPRNTPNDFLSMKETITRRFNEYKMGQDVSFATMPDLVLIDGGKIQLQFAYETLQELGIKVDIVSLAKRFEEVYKPGEDEPYVLPRSNYALKLLQNVRDESHRFAITFHRSLRFKRTLTSELNQIEGIGKTTAIKLQTHFKSVEKIKKANISELMRVDRVTHAQAKAIYDYFHS